MPEVTSLLPALLRGVSALARAFVAAGRSRALCPPERPAVGAPADRLAIARRDAAVQPPALNIQRSSVAQHA